MEQERVGTEKLVKNNVKDLCCKQWLDRDIKRLRKDLSKINACHRREWHKEKEGEKLRLILQRK